MSAFYAICYDDRIEMLTDGAMYAEDGVLRAVRQKVWPHANLPIAITGRGSGAYVETLAGIFLSYGNTISVDRTIDLVEACLARMAAREASEPFELLIAAISEKAGPKLFYVASSSVYQNVEVQPWKLYDAGFELCGGSRLDPGEYTPPAGATPEQGLAPVGVAFFEAMRRKKGRSPVRPDAPPLYAIGGHVDHTVIRPTGCTVARLYTWPDVIGEKIDPFKHDAPALERIA